MAKDVKMRSGMDKILGAGAGERVGFLQTLSEGYKAKNDRDGIPEISIACPDCLEHNAPFVSMKKTCRSISISEMSVRTLLA